MSNKNIVDILEKLVKQIQFDMDHAPNKKEEIKNTYRLKSIKTAIGIINKFPEKITSGDQLKDIKGIGSGIIARINEILNKGKLKEITLDIDSDKQLESISDLEQVFGIGRKKAIDIIRNYNIKSVNELIKAYKKGKIDLNDSIIMGLKYFKSYKQSIPRSEIDLIDDYLRQTLKTIDIELFGIICGSYRRLAPKSNDIDFLIVHPDIKTKNDVIKNHDKKNYLQLVINKLIANGFIVDSLTSKYYETKYMGFCRLESKDNYYPVRRLDIRFMPYESYYTAILYFTGPGDFNRRMRQTAIDQGFMLNEYGLYVVDNQVKKKKIPINSEKDVFDALGLEYLEPENRL